LTNDWLNKITGLENFNYPKIWLQQSIKDTAARLCKRLKTNGVRNIICINFGVGGNLRKKVGRPLEEKLLLSLLENPHTVILLDRGYGEDEFSYTKDLLNRVKAKGYATCGLTFGADLDDSLDWGIVAIQTRIGEIAALIANADEYIGYDSACQHIAAALKTPCLTIFAGSNNMRFIRRWSAFGPSSHQIVHVDTLNNPSTLDIDDIITRIMNERRIQRL
jgi:ADP-heptose:LPS heptosyltransferase